MPSSRASASFSGDAAPRGSDAGAGDYRTRIAALQTRLALSEMAAVGLRKRTSNLFRDRRRSAPKIDVAHFDHVIRVDAERGIVDVEGMTTYEALVDATLAHGVMPCVVPELKSITIGGALAGVGIEASSFKYGLVHETFEAFDVLTGDGRIVSCSRTGDHRDLFFGFPNSYGTLGYALRVNARTIRVKPYVAVEHRRFSDAAQCFAAIDAECRNRGTDFLEGVVFAPDEIYLTVGRFVESAPFTSDYTGDAIYYRSLREKVHDYLTVRDFIWRWDTDWFWCSKQVGAQVPLLRKVYGRARLNSITYQKIMRFNTRWGFTRAWNRLTGRHAESVIQDVDIPLSHAMEYLAFMLRNVPILPIWLCPIRAPRSDERYPLYPMQSGEPYVNFGFWDVVRTSGALAVGTYNRKIEREVSRLGGIKSLYSDSFYARDDFWRIYDRDFYDRLKQRYDPRNTRGDLYERTCSAATRAGTATVATATT